MRLRRRHAGRSAIAIWRAKRREAFRQAWRLNVLSLGMLLVGVLFIVYADGLGELIWAGVIGALLMAHTFIWLLGGHVSQLSWIQGVWGEQQTEEELEKLGQGWFVEHDIRCSRGNWGHVAVSRAGVFMIETKWTTRAASVDGDTLRVGRRVDYPAGGFRGAAVELRDTLETRTGRAPWVNALVVVWGEFAHECVEGDRVRFIRGNRLADWLQKQPIKLGEQRAAELEEAVRTLAKERR